MDFYTLGAQDARVKLGFTGPLLDAGNLGIPSLVAYNMGADRPLSDEQAEEDAKRSYSLATALLVPGYTGYHFGKKHRGQDYLRNAERQQRDKTAGLLSPRFKPYAMGAGIGGALGAGGGALAAEDGDRTEEALKGGLVGGVLGLGVGHSYRQGQKLHAKEKVKQQARNREDEVWAARSADHERKMKETEDWIRSRTQQHQTRYEDSRAESRRIMDDLFSGSRGRSRSRGQGPSQSESDVIDAAYTVIDPKGPKGFLPKE